MGIASHKGERDADNKHSKSDDDNSSSASAGDALPGGSASAARKTAEQSEASSTDASSKPSVLDPTQAYIQEETLRILALTREITARGHDVNIVLTSPVCVGIDDIATEFARRAPGFRFVGSRNQNVTPAQAITAMDSCDSMRRECLSQLAQRQTLPVVASLSGSSFGGGGGEGGGRDGSRASSMGGVLPAQPEELRVASRPALDLVASAIATTLYASDIRRCIECLRGSCRRPPGAGVRHGDTPRSAASQTGPTTATQRLRIFSGSILDSTSVATVANNEFRVLDKWALTTLEQVGELAWREFTEQCPAHSTVYVYLHFDELSYATIYDKYRQGRSPEGKTEMDRLQSFWMAQKRAADNLYHSGANPAVVSRYYVLVLNCFNLQLTNPCTQLYIIDQILSVVDELQSYPRAKLWGNQSRESDRREFINSTDWLKTRYKTIPEVIVSPSAPWRTIADTIKRRWSMDEVRPCSTLVIRDGSGKQRRGSFDGGSSSSCCTSSSGCNTNEGVQGSKVRIGGGIPGLKERGQVSA